LLKFIFYGGYSAHCLIFENEATSTDFDAGRFYSMPKDSQPARTASLRFAEILI